VKADKHWKAHIQLLKYRTCNRNSTFQAELRDYQEVQLAGPSGPLGCGSLLGRSNGTGKTVQALAVISSVPMGTNPVAPTSVCMNWVKHSASPYPQYRSIWWERHNNQQLQPFDMLVCSYGLLQEEVSQMLSQVQWQTIVLDEAQAIKI